MKLSIITINYNDRDGLAKTINSVINQTVHSFEYMVIDGGSSDGSVDVIKQNSDGINYWISEKDTGIYHAMNKGVNASHGDYCLFLNSGDTLIDNNVIEKVLSCDFSEDIVSGGIKYTDGRSSSSPKKVTMKTFVKGSLPHQATFIKRKLLLETPYDERFKIGGDWRFFIQVLVYNNASYKRIPLIISLFDTSGVSSTESKQSERRLYEKKLCQDILPVRIEEDYKFTLFIAKWEWRFKKIIRIIKGLF